MSPIPDPPEATSADTIRHLQDIRAALDVSCIVAMTDRKGVITYVNDTFCRISGYNANELIGQTHAIIRSDHHPRSFFKQMWATIGKGKVWRGDICNRAKGGNLYWVDTTIVPFLDDRGRPHQYMAIRADITVRKATEVALQSAHDRLLAVNQRMVEEHASLVQREKLASIELLASGVAHEINNPLAGAMACLKMLREGSVSAESRDEYFSTVMEALERIQLTVRGLLDYARPQHASHGEVDLAQVARSCARLASPQLQRRGAEAIVELDESVTVMGDRAQLMQAVLNVLLNAAYVSPKGGTVRLDSVRVERDGRPLVGVQVTDQGPGIPQEHIDRVCDPFFSTKPEGEGTGLGLSITSGILRAHGGHLGLEQAPGGGATVTLWLSADPARAE